MKYLFSLVLLFPILVSAQVFEAEDLLNQCITAHGGIKKWNSYSGLTYTVVTNAGESQQTIQLKDRRTYHKTEKYEMGYNGRSTWVKGDKDAVPTKNPDFFHNIDFYFFAIPFVIADPGVNLAYSGKMDVKGVSYEVLEVSYGDKVGIAPGDVYKLLINPNTKQMEWLLYSVTFFDKTSKRLSAKHYTGWQEVNGLLVPTIMENYKFENGEVLGEAGSPRKFKDIKFVKKLKNEGIFSEF